MKLVIPIILARIPIPRQAAVGSIMYCAWRYFWIMRKVVCNQSAGISVKT